MQEHLSFKKIKWSQDSGNALFLRSKEKNYAFSSRCRIRIPTEIYCWVNLKDSKKSATGFV